MEEPRPLVSAALVRLKRVVRDPRWYGFFFLIQRYHDLHSRLITADIDPTNDPRGQFSMYFHVIMSDLVPYRPIGRYEAKIWAAFSVSYQVIDEGLWPPPLKVYPALATGTKQITLAQETRCEIRRQTSSGAFHKWRSQNPSTCNICDRWCFFAYLRTSTACFLD